MIRLARETEIQKIITVSSSCAQAMIAEGIFQWNSKYPSLATFKTDFRRQELYVLTVQQEIRGCVVISTHKDRVYEDVNWLTEDTGNYYIHRLAVAPSFQKKGYGRQLMDFAEAHCKTKKARSIRLDTFSKNLRNQRFYQARGYQVVGKVFFPKQSVHPFYCYELVF